MSTTDTEYDPFDSDLPRVQIPLGRDEAGLTIDGTFMRLYELPDEAAEAYIKYAKQGGEVRIRQCSVCGYLTDAKSASRYEYQSYTCGGCGGRTASGGLQRSASASFPQVYGPMIDPDDDRFVDVAAMVSDTKCEAGHGPTIVEESRFGTAKIDEEARECPHCVPNHPSHLGKLRKRAGCSITRGEMMQAVAEAVKKFREA